MSEPQYVNLYECYRWDCPKCKHRNVTHAVPYEVVPEDAEMFMEELGMTLNEARGAFRTNPADVTCEHCGATFCCHAGDAAQQGGAAYPAHFLIHRETTADEDVEPDFDIYYSEEDDEAPTDEFDPDDG